jgi:curved DNA-binding protein CbpA
MNTDDPYALLGVAQDASPEQLRRAYRRLIRQHHPDTRSGDGGAAADETLRRVMAAYAVLNDPSHRAAYDRRLRRQQATRPPRPARFSRAASGTVPIQAGPVHWTPAGSGTHPVEGDGMPRDATISPEMYQMLLRILDEWERR